MVCSAMGTQLFLLMIHALCLSKAQLSDPHARGLIHIKHKVEADETAYREEAGLNKGDSFSMEDKQSLRSEKLY